MVMATVVMLVLGAPMLYFGIQYATRDPVLTSLDRLEVPGWAAQSPEDRVASGSRWCFIDCRFRERTLQSEGETPETAEVYQAALVAAGWSRWEVEGCPQVAVDGDYTCWRRDEYTLDLWVHPPECAYDPLNLRPSVEDEAAEEGAAEEGEEETGADAEAGQEPDPADECGGSIVEIKMQNRVADERGLSGSTGEQPPPGGELPEPTGSPVPGSPTPDPTAGEPGGDE
jgi:integrin beta 3